MDNIAARPRESRWAFRFSLRTCMALFTVLILAIGYYSSLANKQRAVADALASSGAHVRYRYQYDNFYDEERYSRNVEAEPPWLSAYLGIDYCSPIARVTLIGAANPAEVAKLSSLLPNLRELCIQETELQAEDIKQFADLRKLRGLYLAQTPISDAAVAHLSRLKWLRVLNVMSTRITSEGSVALKAALPNARVHPGTRMDARF